MLAPLFAFPIRSTDPRIVSLQSPITIVGTSIETSLRTVSRDVATLGRRFRALKAEYQIPFLKQPWAFAAVSKDFDERTGRFSYIMGDVVTRVLDLHPDLMAFEIPALTCALFSVRPKNRFGWPFAIAYTKQHVYQMWLPASEYGPAGAKGRSRGGGRSS